MKSLKKEGGFTLIELLIVIAILSIVGIISLDFHKDGIKIRLSINDQKTEKIEKNTEPVDAPKFSGESK